jgi:hypothetical protein
MLTAPVPTALTVPGTARAGRFAEIRDPFAPQLRSMVPAVPLSSGPEALRPPCLDSARRPARWSTHVRARPPATLAAESTLGPPKRKCATERAACLRWATSRRPAREPAYARSRLALRKRSRRARLTCVSSIAVVSRGQPEGPPCGAMRHCGLDRGDG